MMKLIPHLLLLCTLSGPVLAATYSPIGESECLGDYLTLFSKDEINITFAFGYYDYGIYTDDSTNLNRFVEKLTGKCPKWSDKNCGFALLTKAGARPAILRKVIQGPEGKSKTVNLKLDGPSLSSYDQENRSNPAQAKRSLEVKEFFLNGLRTSDVIFYMGHSRDGGGPSFDPPKLKSDGKVDYDWYHKNQKDKTDMNRALQETSDRTRLLVLLSCSSTRWFANEIAASSPKSGIISTSGDYYAGRFDHAFEVLDKILSFQCLKSLNIPDLMKVARITRSKNWNVPAKDQKQGNWSKLQAIENLSLQLSSRVRNERVQSYLELKSFEPKLFTPQVQQRIKDYQFAENIKNQIK